MRPARVVVLGGGSDGVYTALRLERLVAKGAPVDVSLVNRENYLVFQPMLAEVVARDVRLLDTVSPVRQLLRRTRLFVREIEGVDLDRRVVMLAAGLSPRKQELAFDHLVVALGSVTDFRGVPGLPEHALPFKTLADAVRIRNHVIHVLEQSSVELDPDLRRTMLTFVVAGGGFSGTEVAAALNDFVRRAVRDYRSIPQDDVRIILVHGGTSVLERELMSRLATYATTALAEQGIELRLGERLVAASPRSAGLSGGRRIPTRTRTTTTGRRRATWSSSLPCRPRRTPSWSSSGCPRRGCGFSARPPVGLPKTCHPEPLNTGRSSCTALCFARFAEATAA